MLLPIENPVLRTRTFDDPVREEAMLQLRVVARDLLKAEKKDFSAIKIIYALILDEENQDFTRRRVELAEQEFEREEKPAVEAPQLMSAEEMQRRVRILLGKEMPE
jgi:hypothetical protein